jgi:lipopolysaccharide transport system permease protein
VGASQKFNQPSSQNITGRKSPRKVKRMQRFGDRRNLENYRDLLLILVQKELKVRYKNKALGYLWSLINPLAHALIYFIAFRYIMRIGGSDRDYALVLLSGMFPWQWFTNSVGSAPNFFVANASILKKVNFPRDIIPLSAILNHMVHFILTIPIIALLVLIFDRSITIGWLYGIPLLLICQLAMVHGLSLILSSVNLIFRDLERLTSIILEMTFFLTPIIYPLTIVEGDKQFLFNFNPVAPLMISWRKLFLEGYLDKHYVALSFIYATIFLLLGYGTYRRLSWKFAEAL